MKSLFLCRLNFECTTPPIIVVTLFKDAPKQYSKSVRRKERCHKIPLQGPQNKKPVQY